MGKNGFKPIFYGSEVAPPYCLAEGNLYTRRSGKRSRLRKLDFTPGQFAVRSYRSRQILDQFLRLGSKMRSDSLLNISSRPLRVKIGPTLKPAAHTNDFAAVDFRFKIGLFFKYNRNFARKLACKGRHLNCCTFEYIVKFLMKEKISLLDFLH